MKLEDFDAVPQVQITVTTTEAIEALVTAFVALPCSPDEEKAAAWMRSEWTRMQAQGPWHTWPPADLIRLKKAVDVMGLLLSDTSELLALYLIAKRLSGS